MGNIVYFQVLWTFLCYWQLLGDLSWLLSVWPGGLWAWCAEKPPQSWGGGSLSCCWKKRPDPLHRWRFCTLNCQRLFQEFTYIFPCIPCNNSIHVTHEETAAGDKDGLGRARTWLRWASHCLLGSLSPPRFSFPLPHSCSVMLAFLLQLLCVKTMTVSLLISMLFSHRGPCLVGVLSTCAVCSCMSLHGFDTVFRGNQCSMWAEWSNMNWSSGRSLQSQRPGRTNDEN